MNFFRPVCIFLSFLIFLFGPTPGPALAAPLYLGSGRGSYDLSIGLFLGRETSEIRNLSLRADLDLAPYIRLHTIVRSNSDLNGVSHFQPRFDEAYMEFFGINNYNYRDSLAMSLKIGRIRYLRYPAPDAIATFDLPPGTEDLTSGATTGFAGAFYAADYAMQNGAGFHLSLARWGFGESGTNGVMEDYVFFRHDFGRLHFETHAGGLLDRSTPIPGRETGFNVYLGAPLGGCTVGLLYEKLHDRPSYTGILVTFPRNRVTEALGKVAFDYDRSPTGFSLQLPLVSGPLGPIMKTAPPGARLVGEIHAERIRTYWQNGQVRNYYEHRLSSWGRTGDGYIMVVKEEPWFLAAEALVSPHSFGDLSTWEKDRQGPAQLVQRVTYQFYAR